MKKSTNRKLNDDDVDEMFSTEKKAENWLISVIYGSRAKVYCPRCGCTDINHKAKHPKMPFHCKGCRKFFSIRTETVMERSKIPLRKWAKMMYVMSTELRSRPSLKIMNKWGISKNAAWFMNHRIRKAYENKVKKLGKLRGKVQVDETAIGGQVKYMSKKTKERFKERGGKTGFSGKEIIIAAKDEHGNFKIGRIEDRSKESLQKFVYENIEEGSTVMTDEAPGYRNLVNMKHLSVNHSAKEYVKGEAHVNGIESFWSTLAHGIEGSFYAISPKHTERYVNEFAGRQMDRGLPTIVMMERLARAMVGVRLTYKELTADNGLDNFANPVKGSVWDAKRIRKNTVRDEKEALKRMGKPRFKPVDMPKITGQKLAEYLDDEIPF